MKFLLIILLFTGPLFAVPKWWPASTGRVADEVEKLAEVDVKLAEMDQHNVQVDREIQKILSQLGELRGRGLLPLLDRSIDEEAYQAAQNIKLTNGRYREVQDWQSSTQRDTNMFSALLKGAMGGDPTAIASMLLPLMGIGGAMFGKKKSSQAKKSDQDSQRHKAKAIKYANMGEGSKDAIIADDDYPEIT